MIVADTNLIAYLFIPSVFTADAEAVFRKDPEWCAPALWRSEFRNVLWLQIRSGGFTLDRAMRAMENAETLLGGREYNVESAGVLALSAASGVSPYDCEFVIVAQETGRTLVTADRKVLAAFPQVAMSLTGFAS
ncbi:type II toxin-antitoxin system VapC family toxin [Longimicrobium sp.]|uniref:type II toxin-antitoxin system VapC family toxin n=1 Tax=Longimicrobium sp. TaxID=2029185 RepID=UPI002C004850|nr:type II toxin-antitoxin system VapC family toxin [Longimicrobium sp.]HSU14660.1 type II toxin-antitoxin system VapC family toxin [Longimicrobium sp.]